MDFEPFEYSEIRGLNTHCKHVDKLEDAIITYAIKKYPSCPYNGDNTERIMYVCSQVKGCIIEEKVKSIDDLVKFVKTKNSAKIRFKKSYNRAEHIRNKLIKRAIRKEVQNYLNGGSEYFEISLKQRLF